MLPQRRAHQAGPTPTALAPSALCNCRLLWPLLTRPTPLHTLPCPCVLPHACMNAWPHPTQLGPHVPTSTVKRPEAWLSCSGPDTSMWRVARRHMPRAPPPRHAATHPQHCPTARGSAAWRAATHVLASSRRRAPSPFHSLGARPAAAAAGQGVAAVWHRIMAVQRRQGCEGKQQGAY